MIFDRGYRDLDYKAQTNKLENNDDLYSVGYFDQLGAAFDSAYFRQGAGVENELSSLIVERNKKLTEAMRQDGYDESAIHSALNNNPLQVPQSMTKEHYAISNPHYNYDLYKQLELAYPEIDSDEKLYSKARESAKGDIAQADKILASGDALSAKLFGAIGGVFTDPSVVATSMIPVFNSVKLGGASITVGNILKQSGKAAALSAGAETLSIPLQKKNAAFLGEEYGVWEATQNMALAGLGGGVLTAIGLSGLKGVDYIKEYTRGVDDAFRMANADQKAAILEAVDYAHTLGKGVDDGDLGRALPENATPEQIAKYSDDAEQAAATVAGWGEPKFNEIYEQPINVKGETPKTDIDIYKSVLSEDDILADEQIFKEASKIEDLDLVDDIVKDQYGQESIVTKKFTDSMNDINKELDGLESVLMCVRGS